MVDIKFAINNAVAYARELLGNERATNIRLEEVESSIVDGIPVWLITLSTTSPDETPPSFKRMLESTIGTDPAREYKVFSVSKETGELLSMKIRLFATPVA